MPKNPHLQNRDVTYTHYNTNDTFIDTVLWLLKILLRTVIIYQNQFIWKFWEPAGKWVYIYIYGNTPVLWHYYTKCTYFVYLYPHSTNSSYEWSPPIQHHNFFFLIFNF
jgi:hypothetical protein